MIGIVAKARAMAQKGVSKETLDSAFHVPAEAAADKKKKTQLAPITASIFQQPTTANPVSRTALIVDVNFRSSAC